MDEGDLMRLPLRERIRALRQEQQLSHDRVAKALGTTRQTVIGWEKGARPSQHYVEALASFFGQPQEVFQAPREEAVTLPSIAARLEELEAGLTALAEEVRLLREAGGSRRAQPRRRPGGM